jgi:hypothetical protein
VAEDRLVDQFTTGWIDNYPILIRSVDGWILGRAVYESMHIDAIPSAVDSFDIHARRRVIGE